jgi:hypothetical protein
MSTVLQEKTCAIRNAKKPLPDASYETSAWDGGRTCPGTS